MANIFALLRPSSWNRTGRQSTRTDTVKGKKYKVKTRARTCDVPLETSPEPTFLPIDSLDRSFKFSEKDKNSTVML